MSSSGAMARPLALDSPRWRELTHAYGDAADIPELLRQLESFPPSVAYDSASFAAVPHVVKVLATDPARADSSYFHFPAWVEVCRTRTHTLVPSDLAPAYFEALARLPPLVAASAERREWDDDLLLCALAATAASKGGAEVAEAVLELRPEVLADFRQWLNER
jgi:hypothetical protein